MIGSIKNGWQEGGAAAAMSDDAASKRQLRCDFLLSRLLKLGRLPGYNRLRQVWLEGCRINYRFNRGDIQSLREVFIERAYECHLPFEPKTFLDLGANVGLFSVWLSRQLRSHQDCELHSAFPRILAVEAVPDNAGVCELNFRANNLPGEVICAAVAQHGGEAWFEKRSESNLGRLLSGPAQGAITVPMIGIRDLLARFPNGHVDLVKIDIEGGEHDLLSEKTDWLMQVEALMVEWHDDRVDSRPLLHNLSKAGFKHLSLNGGRQDNLSLLLRA